MTQQQLQVFTTYLPNISSTRYIAIYSIRYVTVRHIGIPPEKYSHLVCGHLLKLGRRLLRLIVGGQWLVVDRRRLIVCTRQQTGCGDGQQAKGTARNQCGPGHGDRHGCRAVLVPMALTTTGTEASQTEWLPECTERQRFPATDARNSSCRSLSQFELDGSRSTSLPLSW